VCGVILSFFWVAGVMAELSTQEFIKQFQEAVQRRDGKKIGQLVQQNPEAAKQAKLVLEKAGEGEGESAKMAKAMGGLLSQFLQALQANTGADDPNTAEMNRLNKEAEKYWLDSKYPEAIAKSEEGLKLARKLKNKKYIGRFLGNIGIMYGTLGQYEKGLTYFKQTLAIKREIGDKKGEGKIWAILAMFTGILGSTRKH